MNSIDYLNQSYYLDKKINCELAELSQLKAMSTALSATPLRDKVQTSSKSEAPFTRCIEKIMLLEEQINNEVDTFVDLKEQIRAVISKVHDPAEQLVLKYRYISRYTWEQIGTELGANERTIRRWHTSAIEHVVIPEDAIIL